MTEGKQNIFEKYNITNISDFFLKLPLYQKISTEELDESGIIKLRDIEQISKKLQIDGFCGKCNKETPWEPKNYKIEYEGRTQDTVQYNGFSFGSTFIVKFFCTRCKSESITFLFEKVDKNLIKIGQYPSEKNLNENSLSKYRKILKKENYNDLNSAVICKSSGLGVAAFVYLRRVFENIIYDIYNENSSEIGINKDTFKGYKMGEKIECIKKYLPEFPVGHKVIYDILSKGVHELSEEECNLYYKLMYDSIELVLDNLIEKKRKEKSMKILKKDIGYVHKKLSQK